MNYALHQNRLCMSASIPFLEHMFNFHLRNLPQEQPTIIHKRTQTRMNFVHIGNPHTQFPYDLYSQVLIWPPPAWFEFSNKGSCVFILITSLSTNTSNFTICLNINLQLNYITYTWNYHKMKLSYINNKLTCKHITKLSECVPRTFP